MSDLRSLVQHHLVVKLAAVVGFVGATYFQCKFDHGGNHASTAFNLDKGYIHVFGWVQAFFQFFYLLQHVSPDTSVAETAHKSGWKYFFWALFFSLWVFFFKENQLWVALVFIVLTNLQLTYLCIDNQTNKIRPRERWWFIHFAIHALPRGFANWAFFHTLWAAIGWNNKASDIVADVFVWWFFLITAYMLNRRSDWGNGLVFSFITLGMLRTGAGNTLQHWFLVAISVLNVLYTFTVAYPDMPSSAVESRSRGGEHAPLLSGDA